MPQILPWITGAAAVSTIITGLQQQQVMLEAQSQVRALTEAEQKELAEIRAILSDPNHPTRQILRGMAEQRIGQQVSTSSQNMIARLAQSGLRDPSTIAGPLAVIARGGVQAQGQLERDLITDLLSKRIGLLQPGLALQGGINLANIAGIGATQSGTALGDFLQLLMRMSPQPGAQPSGIWAPTSGPFGKTTYTGTQPLPAYLFGT